MYGQKIRWTFWLPVNSYDIVYLLKNVFEQSKSDDIEAIKNGFINYGTYSGINSDFLINEYGDTIRVHKKQIIINGEFVVVDNDN